ncbi:hypothetical protein [Mycobacteroides abscessus]|uniref:hypothetical protein n=1 Tax=Mycobacteroides abscessus TaxID=36809 RepID=UPI0009411642|nr:hypothetical protein [Mycobacteroides abscessus]
MLLGAILIAVLALAVGLIVGHQSEEKKAQTAKSDCQAVTDMLSHMNTGLTSMMDSMGNDAVYVKKQHDVGIDMQRDADKISDPVLKQKSQQLVDNWKSSAAGGNTGAPQDLAKFLQEQAEHANKARMMVKDLERSCPSKQTTPPAR